VSQSTAAQSRNEPLNYRILREEGPQPLRNMSISTAARDRGVKEFNPGAGRLNDVAVYFIKGMHAPGSVINTWLDINEQHGLSNWGLHQKIAGYGEDFKEASYEILGPFDANAVENATGGSDTKPCPLCGTDIEGELPAHIRNDCEAT